MPRSPFRKCETEFSLCLLIVPIIVMRCWKCWRCISPPSLCGKGQLALGSRDRRQSVKKCCAERLTALQVQRVFYDVHIKCEDGYFWCSAGVERGLTSTGRNSHALFQKSPCCCITQHSSPHRMDQTGLTLPLAFLAYDITHTHRTGFPRPPVSSVWAGWSKVLQMFGLENYWNRLCFALSSRGWHFKLKSFYLKI